VGGRQWADASYELRVARLFFSKWNKGLISKNGVLKFPQEVNLISYKKQSLQLEA
jgi:hypothetical protein